MTASLPLDLPGAVALAAADEPYAGDGVLVVACVVGILAVVLLITVAKVHPFLSLMLGSAVLGAIAIDRPALFLQGTLLGVSLLATLLMAQRVSDGSGLAAFTPQAATVPDSAAEQIALGGIVWSMY